MEAAKSPRTAADVRLADEANAVLAQFPRVRDAVTGALADEASGRDVPTWSADEILEEHVVEDQHAHTVKLEEQR